MENILSKCKENKIYDPFNGIDIEKVNLVNDKILKILHGFNDFTFGNKEEDYEIIKIIILMIIYSYSEEMADYIYIVYNNYYEILKEIINLEYIDRIKILISFIIRVLDNINEKDYNGNPCLPFDKLTIIHIEKEETYKNYPYVKNAFDIFYNIIDNLTEDSPFFQGILQFNSKIYKEVKTGENFHSGTILNLTDIKLELIKNINRFVILSDKRQSELDDCAIFDDKSLSVIINKYSFFDNIYDANNSDNFNNATCIILFLLFHECFGHQKKNINNEKVKTPRKHYDSNFKDIIEEKVDTGNAFEMMLFGDILDLKFMMKNGDLKQFLEPKLYIGKDFNNLRRIYSMIKIEEYNNNKKEESKIIESTLKKRNNYSKK